jgi:hypothetical protein
VTESAGFACEFRQIVRRHLIPSTLAARFRVPCRCQSNLGRSSSKVIVIADPSPALNWASFNRNS